MHRIFVPVALAVGLAACSSSGADGQEAQAIVDVFTRFQTAIVEPDGETAAGLVDGNTLETYRSYRDDALYAEADAVRERSILHRLQILFIRATLPADDLREMTGQDLLAHAIDEGWVAPNPFIGVELKNIQIADGKAEAGIERTDQRTMPFTLEDDGWRLDLMMVLLSTEERMVETATSRGYSEDSFILKVIEDATGEPPGLSIWEPLTER